MSCTKEKELDFQVYSVEILAHEYIYISNDDTVKWYYPGELIFNIKIENSHNDTFIFGAFNRLNTIKWGKFGINYKNVQYSLITNSQASILLPNDSSRLLVPAKNTDLVFMVNPLSKQQFKKSFSDLLENSFFTYEPIVDDYTLANIENYNYCKRIVKFKANIETEIDIFVPDNQELSLTVEDMGFPFEFIPKNIKLNEQIDDFSY